MKGYKTHIEKDTLENPNFRKVVYTGTHLQLVLMRLKGGEDIGEEVHHQTDQFFRFESGTGKCIIDGYEFRVKAGDVLIVPAGARHNVVNTNPTEDLKLYTLYAPPQHKDGVVRATKEEAEERKENFDRKTTEQLMSVY